jgi:hypothetical protein
MGKRLAAKSIIQAVFRRSTALHSGDKMNYCCGGMRVRILEKKDSDGSFGYYVFCL